MPWFAVVAVAQLRLTDLEESWSAGFALLVLGGGLVFVLATVFAGGGAPVRGTIEVIREDYDVRRLVLVALALLAAGAVGVYYKAHVLDGVPLLSGNPDVVRARATAPDGASRIPTWSTALTNCLYLSTWTALVALWTLPRRSPRWHAAGLIALAAVGVFGASLEASRNVTLLALAVPGIGVYLISRPRGRALAAQLGIAAAIVVLVVGGTYVLRLTQAAGGGRDYLTAESDRQPAALRPLLPMYINGAFPLEAARRIHDAFPDRRPYGLGGYSLLSLPDAFFPDGKARYGGVVAALMTDRSADPGEGRLEWTVATYQGRAYADLGATGVLLVSLLLGLGFGWLRGWARRRGGFLAVGIVAYVAYYSTYMVYDNLLSFTLIAVFDLAAIAAIDWWVRGNDLGPALRRLARVRAPVEPRVSSRSL